MAKVRVPRHVTGYTLRESLAGYVRATYPQHNFTKAIRLLIENDMRTNAVGPLLFAKRESRPTEQVRKDPTVTFTFSFPVNVAIHVMDCGGSRYIREVIKADICSRTAYDERG